MSAREFEREDRRIQDAWMRKVVRREPVPCDSFRESVSMAKTFLSVNGRRVAACSFFFFLVFSFINRSGHFVKFTLFIQMREPSRVREEVVLRVTSAPRKTAVRAPNLGEATRELPENPYILHRKTMRVRDDFESSGDRGFMSLL